MPFAYGYGLGDQLIHLFRSGRPDFQEAERLIEQGVDINAAGNDECENILSEILHGYSCAVCDYCTDNGNDCFKCVCRPGSDKGQTMCQIIQFFLDHGFDVGTKDGCYGAQCLNSVVFSSLDRYMVDATKMLFDAGARNRTIRLNSVDKDETPWDLVGTEWSFLSTCEHNHAMANIYEAIYQIYQAVEDSKPYAGIDTYEAAIGKRIIKVLATKPDNGSVFFPIHTASFKKQHCFKQTLYFVFEFGALIVTKDADLWVDSTFPDTELVDVSDYFQCITGDTVASISFDHRSIKKDNISFGQPIVFLEMTSGQKIKFSINFGEVSDSNRAAFFEISNSLDNDAKPLHQNLLDAIPRFYRWIGTKLWKSKIRT